MFNINTLYFIHAGEIDKIYSEFFTRHYFLLTI